MMEENMKLFHAIGSGLAGAAALTLMHEITRRLVPEAPRMDLLGMRAISQSMEKMGQETPSRERLFNLAMAGDLAGNALYYSLVGLGKPGKAIWLRGALLGLAAGVGAVTLPSVLGLGSGPSRRTPATALLTTMFYLEGGMTAATVYRLLTKSMGE